MENLYVQNFVNFSWKIETQVIKSITYLLDNCWYLISDDIIRSIVERESAKGFSRQVFRRSCDVVFLLRFYCAKSDYFTSIISNLGCKCANVRHLLPCTGSLFLNFIHRDKHILKSTNTVKQLYISTSWRM